ncbi:MAG TPA: ribonuclease HII [Candidatus Paceibacterota bacterium]
MPKISNIVGIDEVGRGPLAGPVTLCACSVTADFNMGWFAGIRDSKKLSAKKREEWFARAQAARDAGAMRWSVVSRTAREIDRDGITGAIRSALAECLATLGLDPSGTSVLLDGSLKAPVAYVHQETFIKGDEKIPLISMASVIAKVTRDGHMDKMAKKYPAYGFERHKGYGTALHLAAISSNGMTPIHRKSFMKGLL